MLFNRLFCRKSSDSSANSTSSKGVKLNKKNHQPRRMTLEPLESRDLLTVTTGAIDDAEYTQIRAAYPEFDLPELQADLNVMTITPDDGALSLADLKSAIADAGTTTLPDLILVRTSASANSVTYASNADEISINIDATQYGTITILGWGEENFTLDANQQSRVMKIDGSSTVVNLGGLKITGGNANNGGAIFNSSALTIDNCTITGNTATNNGGGINNNSVSTNVINSIISCNTAKNGGGFYLYDGTLTITDCEISGNTATSFGGGIYQNSGTLTISDSEMSCNTASSGGGISCSGATTITDCTISGNTASFGGGITCSGATTITDCTISGNTASTGGGIYQNSGTLTISDSEISDNTASSGGGISCSAITTIENCMISGNTTTYQGGGISCSGITTITDSTISGNTATSYGGGIYNSGTFTFTGENIRIVNNQVKSNSAGEVYGGGVYNSSTMTLTNSEISGNKANSAYTGNSNNVTAKSYGGGVYNISYGTFTATNVTIAGNRASYSYTGGTSTNVGAWGGGIYSIQNTNLYNTIITENSAITSGGGIAFSTSSLDKTTNIYNSDIVRNTASQGAGLMADGLVYVYNSIIALNGDEETDGRDVWTANTDTARTMIACSLIGISDPGTGKAIYGGGNQIGTAENPLDPGFVDAENGDYALLSTSIAIDKGSDIHNSKATDFAGNARKQGNRIDIGAYEYAKEITDELETPSIVVTTGEDVVDAYDGKISLREAIQYAEAGDTITFDSQLFANGGTMELYGMELAISKDLTIDASDLSDKIVIDANGSSRAIWVYNESQPTVVLKNLTITGGYRSSYGGGIYVGNGVNLTLEDCLVKSNQTYGDSSYNYYAGGGIYCYNSNLALINSTVSNNKATGARSYGGGICSYGDGIITITNSEISGNTATSSGGGIYQNSGTLTISDSEMSCNTASNGGGIYCYDTTTIENCTISGNTAASNGGGIYQYSGTLTITDSEISGNTASSGGGISCSAITTIENCMISGNTTTYQGGGISCSGITTITDSTISDNTTTYQGGGIYNNRGANYSGTFTGENIRIVNNQVKSNSAGEVYGGGVYNFSTMTLTNSEITGNEVNLTYTGNNNNATAKSYGGGIYNFGTFTATNVTIAGNRASYSYTDGKTSTNVGAWGGGIYSTQNMNLYNTIITENSAITSGGGIAFSTTYLDNTTNIYNSDIVGNTASQGAGLMADGLVYVYNSIIALNGNEETDGRDIWTANNDTARSMINSSLIGIVDPGTGKEIYGGGNQIGTAENPLNPGFVNSENGDYALLSTSIAIDKGSDIHNSQETDIAGNARKQGNRIDIGAYEYAKEITDELETPSIVVTTGEDVVDAYDGKISLREAIQYAEAGDTISFDTQLFANGGTMELYGMNLIIDKDLTIDASDLSDKIIIDANGASRAIFIDNDSKSTVVLKNLTITDGYRSEYGGGIYVGNGVSLTLEDCLVTSNQTFKDGGYTYEAGGGIFCYGSNLTLIGSTVSNNRATGYADYGGGICSYGGGVMTITNSVISGNTAASNGGGIYKNSGTLIISNSAILENASSNGGGINCSGATTITDCTISGNTATSYGGGINCSGATTITDCTISGNTATSYGGGIYHYSGTLTISDSEISDNTARSSGGGIYNNAGFVGKNLHIVNNCAMNLVTTSITVSGGGIYNQSSMNLTNCEISGNETNTKYTSNYNFTAKSYGGGIYNSGTLTATNVTIAGNAATYSFTEGYSLTNVGSWGGGIYNTKILNLYNTIIAENAAVTGNDIYSTNNTIYAYNSLSSYTDWDMVVNFEYNPDSALFMDKDKGKYQLVPNIQAFDRGNNEYAIAAGLGEDSLDLAGNERFLNDSIDIGAYESTGVFISQSFVFDGNVDFSWLSFKNSSSVRITWISGTETSVLGTFAPSGEWTWDTTQYPDGAGILKFEYLDEDGNVLLNSQQNATIINDENVVVHRGNVTESTTWENDKVHLVVGRVNIKSGADLTIAANTVVKFWKSSYLYNEPGANLTIAENVVLTRAEDDEVAGDTNKDGELSVAKMGNSYIRGTGTLVVDPSVSMKFVSTALGAGSISSYQTWFAGQVYHVTGKITIQPGATLTIMPGAIVKFDKGCSLVIEDGGTLNALGNAAQPIIFTSVKDDQYGGDTNEDNGEFAPDPGDWDGFEVYGDLVLNHAKVLYAGWGLFANPSGATIRVYSGSITISNSVIAHSLLSLIFIYKTAYNAVITNSIIEDGRWGVVGNAVITNSIISNCNTGLAGSGTITNSIIYQSGGGTSGYLAKYCDFWQSGYVIITNNSGNKSANPLFRNAATGDYHLMPGSPCIDAADSTVAPATDITGTLRNTDIYTIPTGIPNADGDYADIGAYEFTDNANSSIDLTPIDIQAPASANVGDTVTIQWTVRNDGTVAARGMWTDDVYLVSDYGQKVLVKGIKHIGSIPAGDLQTFYADVVIPTVTEGSWKFAVQVNPNREIYEGTAIDNNFVRTTQTTSISIPTLVLSDNFYVSQETKIYKLNIPAGQEYYLKYTYSTDKPNNAVAILACAGSAPTESSYDWNSSNASKADFNPYNNNRYDQVSVLYIPASNENQTIYLSIKVPQSPVTGKMERVSSDFQIYGFTDGIASGDIYWKSVYFGAKSSITLIGTGFNDSMTAAIKEYYNDNADPIQGEVHVISPTTAILSFEVDLSIFFRINLYGQTTLDYNLFVTQDNETKTISKGVVALESNIPLYYLRMPTANVNLPDSIRSGRVYEGTVTYSANASGITAPIFILQADQGVQLSMSNDFSDATNTLQVFGIGSKEYAGMLTNGTYSFKFYFKANSQINLNIYCLTYADDDPCEESSYFATWKEYHEALANAITRLNKRGKTCNDVQKAYQLAVMEKEGYNANAISGYLRDERSGLAVSNVSLIASWQDSDNNWLTEIVKTDDAGYYSIEYLPNNVTVYLDTVDGLALSKNSVTVGDKDVNGFNLTMQPFYDSKTRVVNVSGTVTAYVEYDSGSLKNNQAAEMSLVVKNSGTEAIDAAMIFVYVTDSQGNQKAIMTLDSLLKDQRYATTIMPDGFFNSLQIMASGETAGTIQPGETVTIPIYWGGTLRPWDTAGQEISVGILTSDSNIELDLDEMKESMRPEGLSDTQWNILWTRYTSIIGSTWGSYVQAIGELQAYLTSVGSTVSDVSSLNQMLFAWAMDVVNPMGTLTSSTDNVASTLDFSRAYSGGTVANRFTDSDLGLGWDHNWNYRLTRSDNGDVLLNMPQGTSILYQADKTYSGKTVYRTLSDTNMTLVRSADGMYSLTTLDNTVYTFNANGVFTSVADANGNEISLVYTNGKLTSIADTWGHSLTITWNAAGKIATVVDSYGNTTTYVYDSTNSYLTKVTWSDGRSISYDYETESGNSLSAMKSIAYADGTHLYFSYDELGRVYESHSDNDSQSVAYQFGNTAATLFTYSVYSGEDLQGTVYLNENGQTARTVDALGNEMSYLYDAHGWLVQTADAAGGITQYAYDTLGNIVSITDATGVPLGFTYTPEGNLSELTDAAGNKTQFVYDEFGNLTTMTRADQTFTSYTYNDDGTVNTYTTRAGETFVYAYNADGTVASVTLSTEANPVAYEYDEKGNLVKITDSNGDETAMTYNVSGQLTKVTYANGRYLEYAYDDAGRQTSITDGGSYHIKYAYNALGQLAQVIDGANGNAVLTAYEYDAKGYLVKETNGAGTYTQYAYDSLGYLTSKTTKNASGETLSSFNYTYDALGLISTLTTLDGTWTYGYDAVGQVISEVFVGLNASDNYSASYVYDVNGNRTSAAINGVEHSYTYNAMNQLLSDGEFTYTYNANGSLLTKTNVETGEVWTYSWNQKEELVAVVSSIGESWEYTYDANGNRTSVTHTDTDGNVTTTEYLYDPTGLGWIVAAIENGEIVETYAYGFELISQIDASGSACYYGSDHLGSVCVVTDASGAVLNEYAYDAFGNVLTSTETVANSFQFVGAYGVISDSAPDSLIHMRARYYDPASGRFISEDPLDLSAGDTNLYRYCGNCVTMGIDPSGTRIWIGPRAIRIAKGGNKIINGINNTQDYGQLFFGDDKGKAMAEIAGGEMGRIIGSRIGMAFGGALGSGGIITFAPGVFIGGLIGGWIGDIIGSAIGGYLYDQFIVDLISDIDPDFLYKLVHDWSREPPILRAIDPNEIVGPIGYDFNTVNAGTEDEPLLVITTPNWIASDAAKGQEYRIYFENKSTATAAAQEVFVTMNMPEQFDWNSFELAEICIGNQIFDQMTGYADGVWTVNQTSTGDQIKISFELDDLTGEATWYLRSYVASTADNFPASAYDGFLPPNDEETHDGEGYVSFKVRLDENLATYTTVEANATIVFDANEPIQTNTWLNTIDADIPVVQMDSAELVDAGVALTWSGSDVGSGIVEYQIYVSTNGAAYTLWQSFDADVTSTIFETQTPGEYSFYILAVDGAGNIGGDPEQATPSFLIESNMEMRIVTKKAVHASTDVISNNVETITDWDAFYMEFWTTNLTESQADETSSAKIRYNSSLFQLDTTQEIATPAGITAEISDPILESNGMTSVIVTFTVGEDGYTAPGFNMYWGAVHFTPNTQEGAGIQNPLESETLDVEMGGAASGTTVKAMPFDLNRDGVVDVSDFILFATVYGTNTTSVSAGDGMYTEKLLSDYDGDGAVNVADFIAFATNFGLVKGDGKSVTLPQQKPQANGGSLPNNTIVSVSESNAVEQPVTNAQPEPIAAEPIQEASEQVVIAQAASPVYENAVVTESEIKSAVQVLRQAHSSALLDLYDNQNQSDAPTALFAKAVDESIVIDDDSFDFLFDESDSDADDNSDVDLSAILDELDLELI